MHLSYIYFFLVLVIIFLFFLFIIPGVVVYFRFFGGVVVPFVLDFYSLVFLVVLLIVVFSVLVFSYYYIPPVSKRCFYIVFYSFIVRMILLIIIPDFIFFLVGWDCLGVTSFLLIIYYQRRSSWFSGFKTFIINRLGDSLLVIAVRLLIGDSFLCFFCIWDYLWGFFLVVFFVGLATKRALFPFKSWLPAAMAAPTPVSALVHSSTLVTSGVYIMVRKVFIFSQDTLLFCLLCFSLYTMLIGSAGALVDWDIKKIIAYSTLSQLGLMALMVSLGGYEVGFFHLISHACFKALLFILAGVLILNFRHNQDVRLIGATCPPLLSLILGGCLARLRGLFFLSGFYSKDRFLLVLGGYGQGVFKVVFMLIVAMTFSYRLRLFLFTVSSGGRCIYFTPPYYLILGLIPLFLLSIVLGGYLKFYYFMYTYVSRGYIYFFFFFFSGVFVL